MQRLIAGPPAQRSGSDDTRQRCRRRWPRTCPYCGKIYILTNWMHRRRAGWNKDIGDYENTHTLGCADRPAGGKA